MVKSLSQIPLLDVISAMSIHRVSVTVAYRMEGIMLFRKNPVFSTNSFNFVFEI